MSDLANAVAIVGMACRVPGATNPNEFWRNVRDGVGSLSELSNDRLVAAGVSPSLINDPDYVKKKGTIEFPDAFDASFFGYSPREAEIIDPQQRCFLECSWAALEDSGYDAVGFPGSIGVFAGAGFNTYMLNVIARNDDVLRRIGQYPALLGNDKDYLATRVSYKLDLHGPSVVVQTACSTGLVVIHSAVQNLLSFQCDMALAGAAAVTFPHDAGYLYERGGVMSKDGECRAFDARGTGFVSGCGVAVVVLKRLEDALLARDHVYAIVRGTAINNDGATKVGFTAPSVEGQAEVISLAHAVAGVRSESIGHVQAHGTGTPLGDPIEVAALNVAFRSDSRARQSCVLSSVKPNVGHLDTAAGTVGFIAAALALKHKTLPPTLHFDTPNPALALDDGPFVVTTVAKPWPAGDSPRRAGVSSFGMGGTNAHAVLEEVTDTEPAPEGDDWQLLVMSARSERAADQIVRNLATSLGGEGAPDTASTSYTLQVGRRAFPVRRAAVVRGRGDAVEVLRGGASRRVRGGVAREVAPKLAFVFPGQGSQFAGMGSGVYRSNRVFREFVDDAAKKLFRHIGTDIRELLDGGMARNMEVNARLRSTELAQPALFVVEMGLARLLQTYGITPSVLLGHSLGEYTAACLSGVFEFDDCLRVVAERGRLMASTAPGVMLAVGARVADIEPLLGDTLEVAAINGPRACVLSGAEAAAKAFEESARALGIEVRRLHVSSAFHSRAMDSVLTEFRSVFDGVRLRPPTTPIVSNVTGAVVTAEEATDPGYWVKQLRRTVRFSDCVATLARLGIGQVVSIGPGRAVASLVRSSAAAIPSVSVMRDAREEVADEQVLLEAVADVWLMGAKIDWDALHPEHGRRRVSLPTYPFERKRYALGSARAVESPGSVATESTAASEDAVSIASHESRTPTERAVAFIWKRILGVAEIGLDDDFFALGGDSLLVTQLIAQVRRACGVELAVDAIFQAPTVGRFAQVIDQSRTGPAASRPSTPVALIDADIALDDDVRVSRDLPASEPPYHRALLTGATGFLGAFLLRALLDRTQCNVVCLVRAEDARAAFSRVRSNLMAYRLWRESDAERIRAVPGDVALPSLGLSGEAYDVLAGDIDVVYHAGAFVNFTYPYQALREPNVSGTVNVLKFVAHRRTKPLHFMSTTAVYSSPGYACGGVVLEDAPLSHSLGLHTAYAASKWAAEGILAIARARGFKVAIYRPATVSGHSKTGVSNLKDFTLAMMKGCIQLGCVPDIRIRSYTAPADWVAEGIVEISSKASSHGRAFHMVHPEALRTDRIFEIMRRAGFAVKTLPYPQWRERLIAAEAIGTENALVPFIPILHPEGLEQLPELDSRNTTHALSTSELALPDVENHLLPMYLAHFIETGFVPSPSR